MKNDAFYGTKNEPKKVQDAINLLVKIGTKHYQQTDGVSIGAAIGSAIYMYISISDCLELAATVLEENNFHQDAARIRKMR
jgi:hypothetical protein